MISFFDPERITEQIYFPPNSIAADFGCGSGGFTIPLAKKILGGVVYALDIQSDPLSALEGNAKLFGLNNIKCIRCNLEEPSASTLPDESVDFVFIINLLFQTENDKAVLAEAKRILKPSGKIVIVEWKKDSPFGPDGKRMETEDIKPIMRKLELKLSEEIDAGTYHWGVILEK